MNTWYSADETIKVDYSVEYHTVTAPYGNAYVEQVETAVEIEGVEILGTYMPRRLWREMPTLLDDIEKNIRKEID